jgi:hypothetical protein
MQSKDLRIGNYIDYPDSNIGISKIHHFGFDHLSRQYLVDGFDIDDFLPIPITKVWLLNFGFEDIDLQMSGSNWLVKNHRTQWKKQFRISFHEQLKVWNFTIECVSPPTLSLCEIKYVHQLQNLYFALTGEELELKHESKP